MNQPLLQRLDSLIVNRDAFTRKKEAQLKNLRSQFQSATTERQKLSIARQLTNEYMVFNADSALHYVSVAKDIANSENPVDKGAIQECIIDEAYILSVMGCFEEAEQALFKIGMESMDLNLRLKYFKTLQYAYSIRSVYLQSSKNLSEDYKKKSLDYLDSLIMTHPKDNPSWMWVDLASSVLRNEHQTAPEAQRQLKQLVDANELPDRDNAINAYWLGRYYEADGDVVNALHYYAVSAINDAEIDNREIAAIQELASNLFELGDVDRAYSYFNYGSAQAVAYQNRNRILSISNAYPIVHQAYMSEIHSRDRRLSVFIWILAAFAVSLILLIVYVIKKNKSLHKIRKQLSNLNGELAEALSQRNEAIKSLEASNSDLEGANENLENVNKDLEEANNVKRAMLALTFSLTTDYINAFEDFRKKLLRKYKLNKKEEFIMMLADQDMVVKLYGDFYKGFDKAILSIFPGFVEEYNSVVDADSRADATEVEKSQTLNTKMRIYAVKRLGVTKSADIAKMLNLSIRTVYNNRVQLSSEE